MNQNDTIAFCSIRIINFTLGEVWNCRSTSVKFKAVIMYATLFSQITGVNMPRIME